MCLASERIRVAAKYLANIRMDNLTLLRPPETNRIALIQPSAPKLTPHGQTALEGREKFAENVGARNGFIVDSVQR